MRVDLVTSLDHGGPLEHSLVLAEGLTGLGVEVHAVCASEELAERFATAGARAEPIALRASADAAAAARIWRATRGADIVHAQDRRSGLWTRLGPRPRRAGRRVYTVHGLPDEFLPGAGEPGLRARLAYRGLDAALCRRADAVVVASRALGDLLVERLRFPRHKLTVVPNGVRVPERPVTPGARVGTVATVEPVKRLELLIEAATILAREDRELSFVVYGEGSDRERLSALAARAPARVELAGRVEKSEALASLSVFVLCSAMENAPMAMLEAMAAGIPVVATRVGGVPEIAAGVATLVEPDDPIALAGAIADVLAEPERARGRAAAARARVAQRYSLAGTAKAALDLYRRLLEGGSR